MSPDAKIMKSRKYVQFSSVQLTYIISDMTIYKYQVTLEHT